MKLLVLFENVKRVMIPAIFSHEAKEVFGRRLGG